LCWSIKQKQQQRKKIDSDDKTMMPTLALHLITVQLSVH
jgi:hypothetical protein